jgi:arylsulfatase A-like enzyme
MLRGNTGTSKKDYTHDLFTDRALKFIEKHRSEPFFLDLALTIPHTNNELGRDTGNGQEVPSDAPYSGRNWPQVEKNFAAMITRMDGSIGKILETLRKNGIAGNTLVIFTSDNGPHKEGGHSASFFESSGPLRGTKRDLYEGGIRVPAIAWSPGSIKAGQVSDAPWAFWDFLPSIAELVGASVPTGLDGISVVPQWHGAGSPKRSHFYWEHNEGKNFVQAVRVDDLKAVRTGPGTPLELYDLRVDPSERRNIALDQPAKVKELEALIDRARTDSPDFPIPRA